MVEALGLEAWRWEAKLSNVNSAQFSQSDALCGSHHFDSALFHAVENNCGYHLFESDSDEDEEEATEKKEEEPPKKKSAFQVNEKDTLNVFLTLLLEKHCRG